MPRSGQVSLAGIAPAVVTEILFGLQQRTRQGVKTHDAILRAVCDDARSQQVTSLADLEVHPARGKEATERGPHAGRARHRGACGPETETAKDIWDMTLFGHSGRLSFTAITQPWLRETAKIWAAAPCPAGRGRSGGDKTRHYIASIALLSQSLRQRPDRGGDPAAMGASGHRGVPGPARLAALRPGRSASSPGSWPAARPASSSRRPGSSARPGPARRPGGSSDQFAVHRDDTPDEPEHGEPGRDLPAEIMRQVSGHLPSLHAPHIRTAIEILIDTGRRPEDVVALPLDSLAGRRPGQLAVLIYDNQKENRLSGGYRSGGRRRSDPHTAASCPRPVPGDPSRRAEAAAHRLGKPRGHRP